MSLKGVVKALKKLGGNDGSRCNLSPSDDEVEHLEYFCAEDTLLTNDLNVTVKGVGKLFFPLTSDTVKNIVKVSTKAKFGKGEATLLDTTVRDTQMIPENMLKVGINEESLSNILERISLGLNIDKNSRLVPHLYNMLIYGPGQFFKMHRDSEKIKNMVATLVVLLPSAHKGGDLIIRHKNSKHIFFASQKHNVVKCIAFYSDCQHEIEKVTEGYRVALTYNVVLNSPGITSNVLLDEDLNRAVQLYFSSENTPERLVFYLNHSYSEHSLKWDLLKGTDRKYAFSLLTVAKEQGRVPCLALAVCREETEMTGYYEDVIGSDTELVFWVDEFNLKFIESTDISDEELCYITETDLFEPYKVEETAPTGNEGGYKENWYRRACVVLWSNKWDFQYGFTNALHDLKKLTTEKGNENLILDEINKAGDKFFDVNFWKDSVVINLLMDIAAYVKNKEKAIAILTKLSNEVVNSDRIGYLLFLEQNYDREVLFNIIQSWCKVQTDGLFVKKSLKIIETYLKHSDKKLNSLFVEILLKRTVKEFLRINEKYCDMDIFKGTQLNTVSNIFQICADLEHFLLEEKVISLILLHPSVYPLHFGTVLSQIQNMINQKEVRKYRNFALATSKLFDDLVFLLNKDKWSWPFNFPCKCQHCGKLIAFLHSSDNVIDVALGKANKSHINSVLQYLKEQPVKCTKESSKVTIEKLPTLLEARMKLLSALVANEKQLKEWISTKEETVYSECTVGNNNVVSLNGSLDNQQICGESANKRKKIK